MGASQWFCQQAAALGVVADAASWHIGYGRHMMNAIVYATRHGATAEVAADIAAQLGGHTDLFNLADGTPDLSRYDLVVLGTPVYLGQPSRMMTRFLRHVSLEQHRVGLYVIGLAATPELQSEELSAAYPQYLRDHAEAAVFIQGLFPQEKLTDLERTHVQKASYLTENLSGINADEVATLAATLHAVNSEKCSKLASLAMAAA